MSQKPSQQLDRSLELEQIRQVVGREHSSLADALITLAQGWHPPTFPPRQNVKDDIARAVPRIRAAVETLRTMAEDDQWADARDRFRSGQIGREGHADKWARLKDELGSVLFTLESFESQKTTGRRTDRPKRWLALCIGRLCSQHGVAVTQYESGTGADLLLAVFNAAGEPLQRSNIRPYLKIASRSVKNEAPKSTELLT